MNSAIFFESGTVHRHDLITYEPLLKEALHSLFAFSSYSLIFPPTQEDKTAPTPEYPYGQAVLEQDRVLVPLVHQGRLLAVFVARGIDVQAVQAALPYVPRMAGLCVEHVQLRKQAVTDRLTGLFNQTCLERALEREINDIAASILPGLQVVADETVHAHSACLGLMLIDLDQFKRINERYGHLFGDGLLVMAAERVQAVCPKQSLVCRAGSDTFAVLWPQVSRTRLAELAQSISQDIRGLCARFTPLREDVSVTASIGMVNYPQDFQGQQFQKTPAEQARLLMEKAERALNTARQGGPGRIYAFQHIVSQGGVVLDVLPMNRLVINLGRSVDVREGQRFLLWSRTGQGRDRMPDSEAREQYRPMCKGEISVIDVQDAESIAEILFQADSQWSVEPGDTLTVLDDHDGLMEQRETLGSDQPAQKDPLTGLYAYRDFLSQWRGTRGYSKTCSMVLVRLATGQAERTPMAQMREEQMFHALTEAVSASLGAHVLGGRYSMNCVVYYASDVDSGRCVDALEDVLAHERWAHAGLRVGVAGFPCLDFSRSDLLDNARKALDHAALLQDHHIACFDSVSLNISADRLFAQGELYDAIAEYKRALTMDEENFLARNSLGICYAWLNKFAAARSIFQELMQRHPEHIMPMYNYACTCLKDGDADEARATFAAVLRIDPDHVYSILRLALLAEETGEQDQAWELYQQVLGKPDGARLAYRYLARLAFRRGERDTAREFLHQAITASPHDAYSFHLLARLYLEGGEDPEVAESLARQSVHLKGDIWSFWEVLIEALEQQGKTDEARQTRVRASAQVAG
ncbi:tetratricopeptide repeat protein [Desulfovibrionales bacterium]